MDALDLTDYLDAALKNQHCTPVEHFVLSDYLYQFRAGNTPPVTVRTVDGERTVGGERYGSA